MFAMMNIVTSGDLSNLNGKGSFDRKFEITLMIHFKLPLQLLNIIALRIQEGMIQGERIRDLEKYIINCKQTGIQLLECFKLITFDILKEFFTRGLHE